MYRANTRVWLKEYCRVCGGNIYVNLEDYGRLSRKCLQCGREFKLIRGARKIKRLIGV